MKKIIGELQEWFYWLRLKRHESRQARRISALEEESLSAVQIKEFEGDVWLSLYGVPVVPSSCLKCGIPGALLTMREAWVSHQSKDDHGRRV